MVIQLWLVVFLWFISWFLSFVALVILIENKPEAPRVTYLRYNLFINLTKDPEIYIYSKQTNKVN